MSTQTKKRKPLLFVFVILGLCISVLCIGVAITALFDPGEDIVATTEVAQVISVSSKIPATAEPSNTPEPTNNPQPTNTPRPTHTPRPTATKAPTATSTPVPDPIYFSGSGNSVVDLNKWIGPDFMHVIGPTVFDNFFIRSYDANGNELELLVNALDNYDGMILLDPGDDDQTARLQVEAGGTWEIEILPTTKENAHILTVPGTYDGRDDDIIFLSGSPDLLMASSDAEVSNFFIRVAGEDSGLIVNEITPFSGTYIIPEGTVALIVEGQGPWRIEITSK